jgi:hypothetical protein
MDNLETHTTLLERHRTTTMNKQTTQKAKKSMDATKKKTPGGEPMCSPAVIRSCFLENNRMLFIAKSVKSFVGVGGKTIST